jgi:hypothetical protein
MLFVFVKQFIDTIKLVFVGDLRYSTRSTQDMLVSVAMANELRINKCVGQTLGIGQCDTHGYPILEDSSWLITMSREPLNALVSKIVYCYYQHQHRNYPSNPWIC